MTLHQARQRRFLSQRELAKQAGISRLTISLIEQGKTRPRPKTARTLAEALGVEPGEIDWPRAEEEAAGDGE